MFKVSCNHCGEYCKNSIRDEFIQDYDTIIKQSGFYPVYYYKDELRMPKFYCGKCLSQMLKAIIKIMGLIDD